MTRRGLRRLAALGIVAIIFAAALGGALIVKREMHRRNLASLREQGLALHHSGEHEAAIPLLRRYVRGVRDDPEVLIAFGLSRQEVELPNGRHIINSIAALKTALELEPGNARATESLMELFAQAQYRTELVDTAEQMLALEPTHRRAMTLRVDALILLGRNKEAVSAAEALVATHGDLLESHDRLVEALRREGRPTGELIETLRAHESRFSDHPGYFDRLSRIVWESGDRVESVRLARTAASLPPRSAKQVADLVDWLRVLDSQMRMTSMDAETGDGSRRPLIDVADELLTRAIEDDAIGPQVAIEATRRAWWANQDDLARQYAARLDADLQNEDRDARGWARLVSLTTDEAVLTDRAGGDETEADTGESPGLEDDWWVIHKAVESINAGQMEQSLNWLERFTPSSEHTPALARYLHGLSLQRIGDLLGAAASYRDVLNSREIERDRVRKSLGEVLAGLGMYKESEQVYRGMSRRDTVPLQTRIDLLLSGLEANRDPVTAQTVLRFLRQAMTESPDHPGVRARLARALILAGRSDQGIEEARGLLADDNAPDPLGLLGLCWTLYGIDKPLVLDLLAAFQAGPDNADLLFSRAMIQARSGDLDGAQTMLEAEVESRSGADAVPYLRALARLLDQYDRDAALDVYRTLTDEHENSAMAQLAVLDSITPWTDLDLIRAAVARLRAVVGENNLSCLVYDARLTLADEPSDNELSQVILSLRDVLSGNPDDFYSLFLTARAFLMLAEGHLERGSSTQVTENIDQAASYFERAAGPASRAVAYRPYVQMLLDHGRIAEANRVLDRFLVESDVSFLDRKHRIELLTRVGRWRDAIVDQAWFATAGNATNVLNLAELHTRSGDRRRAYEIIEAFLAEDDPAPNNVLRAAEIYAIAGDFSAAQSVLETLPEQSVLGNRDAVAGRFFMGYRRPDLAMPYLVEVARREGTVGAWTSAIQAASAAGEQAAALLAEARKALPDAPELAVFDTDSPSRRAAQVFAASVDSGAGDAERELASLATEHALGRVDERGFADRLEAFCGAHPGVYAAWRLRSLTHQQSLGETERAIDVCREAAEAIPDDPRPWRDLTRLLAGAGRYAEAIGTAESMADLTHPDTYDADVLVAELLNRLGRPTEAINRLVGHRDRIQSLSSDSPSAGLSAYVLALAGAGEPGEAAELLESRWGTTEPAWIDLILRAVHALPSEHWAEKRDWLRFIEDDRYALVMAELWVEVARYSGLRADVIRATTLYEEHGDPANPAWRFVLAKTAALSERYEQAESDYRALIEAFPDTIASYVGVADALSRQPDRADEALAFIETSIARFGAERDPVAFRALQRARARALGHAGRDTDARSFYEQLLEIEPNDSAAAIGLAQLLLDAGETVRARELLGRVTEPDRLDAQTRGELIRLQSRLQVP